MEDGDCGPFQLLWSCCDKRANRIGKAIDTEKRKEVLSPQVVDDVSKKRGFGLPFDGPQFLKCGGALPTSGFGIVFAQNDDGLLYVHSLVSGSPASLAEPKICVGDVLCSIDSVSVYKQDLLFVAKCMAGATNKSTAFGFCGSDFIPSSDNPSEKIVVICRQTGKKEPEIKGPSRLGYCSSDKVTNLDINIEGSAYKAIALKTGNILLKDVDTSVEEEISTANKLRDQGSYADAIKLYRKILSDFASNHPSKSSAFTDLDKENSSPN